MPVLFHFSHSGVDIPTCNAILRALGPTPTPMQTDRPGLAERVDLRVHPCEVGSNSAVEPANAQANPGHSRALPESTGTQGRRRAREDALPYWVPPRLVRGKDVYQRYFEQEAEQFASQGTERGVAPFIPPTGKDINSNLKWMGIPMTKRDRLAYAWGAANTAHPYGLAELINQGAPLATAVSQILQGIEPIFGVGAWYTNQPVWPIKGHQNVLVGQNSRVIPTTSDLRGDMDRGEREVCPGEVRQSEFHLSQSMKLRLRTYKGGNGANNGPT